HKLLSLIVSPLGLLISLMLLALLLRRQWPVYWALLIVLVCSFPLTARSIWVALESEYPYQPMSAVPKVDAVLVLSGMLGGFETEDGYVTEWGDPDRFFVGVQLVKLGKADRLIFTRGQMPWSESPPEGEMLKQKALEMGVSPDQILLTSIVSNTAEESLAVKELMAEYGLTKIILVTSSFHLPRAKLLFDKAGVDTYPYPADFKAASRDVTWLHFIPSADAFRNTSNGIREYIGRFYYWLKYA
ncbi:YdcF family protein, partial [Litoricola sp.]|nr:YdcF family protein [Litorivicinus sp.]